jgi:hypothetical protein
VSGSLEGWVHKTWGDKHNRQEEMSMINNTEVEVPVHLLRMDADSHTAMVEQRVTTKISDSEQWGEGTWDKIPYSVEVSCSVRLVCDQTEDGVRAAAGMAYDLAWSASRKHLGPAVVKHVQYIRTTLYPELFKG